ncbi:hypothetical protein IE53DRAFT_385265 [Violaceomyces palustris]|uniref:Uncharacterized protein n=1 Tax=Violaceomyces palustris TaxID=1673888 RepID=A0ACD0P2Y4_9BASI|nr:hypothetical protein IE53DRAFT_385265 [Violaceomyces palustris]
MLSCSDAAFLASCLLALLLPCLPDPLPPFLLSQFTLVSGLIHTNGFHSARTSPLRSSLLGPTGIVFQPNRHWPSYRFGFRSLFPLVVRLRFFSSFPLSRFSLLLLRSS